MAVYLVRAVAGEPAANYCGGSSSFNDVSPGAWSCPYIKRLSELNITGGCGGGNYCPQGLVTRDQMAAFIVRAVAGEPALDYCGGVAPFQDVPPSAWSCRYIKRLAEIGVTQGCGGNNYCPQGLVTREQMAAFLARAFLGPEPYPLNDTGLDWCANASQNNLACPVSGFPGQDAQYGRDVTHNDDSDGHAGFSFTKIANSGNPLPNSAALGSGANAWGCTRDNVTGLTWEVKTDNGGLRDQDWTYSWYNPDAATNGGSAGYADYGNNCFNTARCDTDKFVADVNAQGLCGASDWRLPNRFELESLTSNDRYNPAIDTAFFPNTPSNWFWSSSPDAYGAYGAWSVGFDGGYVGGYFKYGAGYVRLVRGGQ